MLDTQLKQQLASYLTHLVTPVELILYCDDSAKSNELQQLAQTVSELSDKVSLRQVGQAERVPSLVIASVAGQTQVNFAAVPMGHEFSSFVLALLQQGGHPSKLAPEVIEQVQVLSGDYHFTSYVSLSCQNCPDVVQALNTLASLNPNIRHTMVDGALFPEEVEALKIKAVPTVMLNGQVFSQGRISVSDILAKLDSNAGARQTAQLASKDPFDMLVVGGGPAAAAAAIYAARKGIRTGIVAERFGGQVMDTLSIENFISVQETEGPKLVASLEQHVRQYEVDIMDNQRATSLGTSRDGLRELTLDNGARLRSRSVLLATGARWREMQVPGEREYRNKGVAYCPHCDGPLFKGQAVAVIGGGNSGVEAAIDLAGIVQQVTLLEYADALKADQVLQDKLASLPNVSVITQAQTLEVLGDGQQVTGLSYRDRSSGETSQLSVAGIFVQIGLVPNTEWLQDSEVALTAHGEIQVGARGETQMPGVFAAGDVTTAPYKQIIIAMGDGANAALGAFDYLIRQLPEPQQAEVA